FLELETREAGHAEIEHEAFGRLSGLVAFEELLGACEGHDGEVCGLEQPAEAAEHRNVIVHHVDRRRGRHDFTFDSRASRSTEAARSASAMTSLSTVSRSRG